MSKINIVGHCYRPSSNSDKIYMCCIREVGGKFTVLAKWGRRGKNLSNQDKGTFGNLQAAEAVQLSLWKTKANEGYLDIETQEYANHIKSQNGPVVTMVSPGIVDKLEKGGGVVPGSGTPVPFSPAAAVQKIEWECDACGKKYNPIMTRDGKFPEVGQGSICSSCVKKAKEMAAKRMKDGEDEVLVCVDNTGMEDRFDIGIEYIVEEHKDKTMVFVYDKMGRKDEYFRTRFMTQEMWDRKNGIVRVETVKNRETTVPASVIRNGEKDMFNRPKIDFPKDANLVQILDQDGNLIQTKTMSKSSSMPVRA